MSQAQQRVVSIHYTLTNDQGEVLDSSEGREPLSYLEGAQNIIPGLENALSSLKTGDSTKVSIEPEDAYGERHDHLIQEVPRSAFQGVDEILPGMQFHAETPQGMQVIQVIDAEGDTVTIDANHPLAGERLHFSVDIIEIRDASDDEVAHGHAHNGDDHHH
jgi:FKBP-type peptidyl-prolyl cis-trans isomerase SlyD